MHLIDLPGAFAGLAFLLALAIRAELSTQPVGLSSSRLKSSCDQAFSFTWQELQSHDPLQSSSVQPGWQDF